jgi:hypothetical protein
MTTPICSRCETDATAVGFIGYDGKVLCTKCLTEAMKPAPPSSLELATSDELMAELLGRSTFRGVVVWQPEAWKGGDGETPTNFRWESRNCDEVRLLRHILEVIGG